MAFKVIKSTSYYLNIGTPPCIDCECTQSIKQGLKSCPYLDSSFYMKVNKNRVEELKTSPYTFVDFPYLHLINSTFERIDLDEDVYEILIR